MTFRQVPNSLAFAWKTVFVAIVLLGNCLRAFAGEFYFYPTAVFGAAGKKLDEAAKVEFAKKFPGIQLLQDFPKGKPTTAGLCIQEVPIEEFGAVRKEMLGFRALGINDQQTEQLLGAKTVHALAYFAPK